MKLIDFTGEGSQTSRFGQIREQANYAIKLQAKIAELEATNKRYATLDGDLMYITRKEFEQTKLEQQAKGIESLMRNASAYVQSSRSLNCLCIREAAKLRKQAGKL